VIVEVSTKVADANVRPVVPVFTVNESRLVCVSKPVLVIVTVGADAPFAIVPVVAIERETVL
jgi:hypothetical protein